MKLIPPGRAPHCFVTVSGQTGAEGQQPCLFVHRCLLGWRRKRASLALLAAFYERCFSHDLFPVWTLCELQAAVWCFRPKWESGCPLMQTRFGLDASHSL